MIKLLEETVDPSSWRDNGGKVGSIRELAGQLIVRQTEANQREILAQHLRTTVVIPVGEAVVVGGMTLDPSTTGGGDGRQIYLILQVVGTQAKQ